MQVSCADLDSSDPSTIILPHHLFFVGNIFAVKGKWERTLPALLCAIRGRLLVFS